MKRECQGAPTAARLRYRSALLHSEREPAHWASHSARTLTRWQLWLGKQMRQFRDILQYRQVRKRRHVDRVSLSLEPRLQSPALVGALAACRGTEASGPSARLCLDATTAPITFDDDAHFVT